MAIVETLVAGGDCLDESSLLRADGAQRRLRGHGLPDATMLGAFHRMTGAISVRRLTGAAACALVGKIGTGASALIVGALLLLVLWR